MNDKSEDPLSELIETNCSGSLNLARHAIKIDIKRLVFLSSIWLILKNSVRIPF